MSCHDEERRSLGEIGESGEDIVGEEAELEIGAVESMVVVEDSFVGGGLFDFFEEW